MGNVTLMKYKVFIDECGSPTLKNIDRNFPVFVLCGVVFQDVDYEKFRFALNLIKIFLFDDKSLIFHSVDIRRKAKRFLELNDSIVLQLLMYNLNEIIGKSRYQIISAAIHKEKHKARYGANAIDPYNLSFEFFIERLLWLLKEKPYQGKGKIEVDIYFEQRGKKEDNTVKLKFEEIKRLGTRYLTVNEINKYNIRVSFVSKKANINGHQLADLVAYPIARYVMDGKFSKAFDILYKKLFRSNGKVYGLKIFP